MRLSFRAFLPAVIVLAGLAPLPRREAQLTIAPSDFALTRAASVRLGHKDRSQVVRWLRRQPGVAHAGIGLDGATVDITYQDGLHSAILARGMRRIPAPVHGLRPGLLSRVEQSAPGSSRRAAVLEPFGTMDVGVHPGDYEVTLLRNAGFQVDQLIDADVTVDTMATLHDYNVVYMETHAGVNEYGDAVVATGQVATDHPSPALAAMLQEGSVFADGVAGTKTLYYGVVTKYIQTYEGQFPNNAIVFINTCDLLRGPMFYRALFDKGVGVLVSWDHEASMWDAAVSSQAFFQRMVQGETVAQSVASVLAQGFGRSFVDNRHATMGYAGNGTIDLRGNGDPPTPTPTPLPPTATATATATQTAVPSPTMTSTPVLDSSAVSMAMRKQVAPGAVQAIHITAAPHVPVRIDVQYPNGDVQSAQGSTDGQGTITYSYEQRPSEITHRSRTATVRVTAGSVTREEPYSILFGRVDVSVEPRTQQPGGAVVIWTHSASHVHVQVSLQLGSQNLSRLASRTGPHGWAHMVYRLGSTVGPGSQVGVVARAYNGTKVSGATTTFRVVGST